MYAARAGKLVANALCLIENLPDLSRSAGFLIGQAGVSELGVETTPEKTGKFVEWTLHTNITTTDSIIIQKAKEARGKERKVG